MGRDGPMMRMNPPDLLACALEAGTRSPGGTLASPCLARAACMAKAEWTRDQQRLEVGYSRFAHHSPAQWLLAALVSHSLEALPLSRDLEESSQTPCLGGPWELYRKDPSTYP